VFSPPQRKRRNCSCALLPGYGAALREDFAQHVLAGFDKTRIGFDRAGRLASGITLTEIQLQTLNDLPWIRRQQNQVRGEEHRFFDVVG